MGTNNKISPHEITEQKSAKEALREQKDKAEKYLNIVGNIILALDREGNVSLLNRKGYEVLGYLEGELNGQSWIEKCILPQDRAHMKLMLKDWVDGKIDTPPNHENYVMTKSGDKRLISWINSLLKNEAGRVIGTLSSGEDITERKKTEHALMESKSWIDSVFASMNDAVITFDTAGNIISFNKAYMEINKYKNRSDVHKSLKAFFLLNEIRSLSGKLISLEELPSVKALKGETGSKELIIKRRDTGREWIANCSYAPVFVGESQVGAVLVLRDVTEQKLAQILLNDYSKELEAKVALRTRELRETQDRLLRTERLAAIGELAGMVGHDLRNPLTGIKNAAYYLRKKGVFISEVDHKSMLDVIEKGVYRSDKIINDLLDYAKDMTLELEQIQVEEVIKDALAMAGISEKVEVIINVSGQHKITADQNKIERVFINIIKNAMDAMPNGGTLTIECKQIQEHIQISFTDKGSGIPEEILPKIFSPLFTTKAQGMGFGLAICKRIIEAHGGKITFETMKGKSTTFIITLPNEKKMDTEN